MEFERYNIMTNQKALLVGGTFGTTGDSSSLIHKIYDSLAATGLTQRLSDFHYHNGGTIDQIKNIIVENDLKEYKYIFWFPNILDNNEFKWVKLIKEKNPHCILVTSKRNLDNEYSFGDLIQHALVLKSNLLLEFSGSSPLFKGRLIDPLGNVIVNYSDDFNLLSQKMANRVKFLSSITRVGSVKVGEKLGIPDETKFFDFIKKSADIFSTLMPETKKVERFLGNSSFRCRNGFPSFRKDGLIYVSKRNVDKKNIGKDGFVAVNPFNFPVEYYGDDKPSVDTPVHLELYEVYPNINYLLHGHVYVTNSLMTKNNIPCGGLQEVNEIISLCGGNAGGSEFVYYFCINLKGHGFILGFNNVSMLDWFEWHIKRKSLEFISRPYPELL